MRLTISVVLVGIMAAAAFAASPSDGKLTLDVQDADINAVIKTLFDQTGKSYGITEDVRGLVNAHFEDVTLDQALKLVLSPRGFTWKVVSGAYIIEKKKDPPKDDREHIQIPPIPEKPRDTDNTEKTLQMIPLNFLDARDVIAFVQGDQNLADSLRKQGIAGMMAYPFGPGGRWNTGVQPYITPNFGTPSGPSVYPNGTAYRYPTPVPNNLVPTNTLVK